MKKIRPVKSHHFMMISFLLIAVCFSTVNCSNKENETPPVFEDEIMQPPNPNDPVVLPEVKTVIRKLDGDFTPLLTGAVLNWRVKSHKKFGSGDFACWSDWKESYFYGVTREGVAGQNVYYPGCGIYGGGTHYHHRDSTGG